MLWPGRRRSSRCCRKCSTWSSVLLFPGAELIVSIFCIQSQFSCTSNRGQRLGLIASDALWSRLSLCFNSLSALDHRRLEFWKHCIVSWVSGKISAEQALYLTFGTKWSANFDFCICLNAQWCLLFVSLVVTSSKRFVIVSLGFPDETQNKQIYL